MNFLTRRLADFLPATDHGRGAVNAGLPQVAVKVVGVGRRGLQRRGQDGGSRRLRSGPSRSEHGHAGTEGDRQRGHLRNRADRHGRHGLRRQSRGGPEGGAREPGPDLPDLHRGGHGVHSGRHGGRHRHRRRSDHCGHGPQAGRPYGGRRHNAILVRGATGGGRSPSRAFGRSARRSILSSPSTTTDSWRDWMAESRWKRHFTPPTRCCAMASGAYGT